MTAAFGFVLASCSSSGPARAPTAVAPTGQRDCFSAAQIANFAVVDRETVNMRAGTNGYFQIKLLGVCPQFNWTQPVGLSTAGTNTVCTGYDLTLAANTASGVQECAAESLRRLSPAEVNALPATYRP